MFAATPILFIGTVGNQLLASPDGLEVLLSQPDFDPISSMREVDTVVAQVYRKLGKEGDKIKEALKIVSHFSLIPDASASDARTALESLACSLRKIDKTNFEKAASMAMQTCHMAFLWASLGVVRQEVAAVLRAGGGDPADDSSLEGIVRRAKAHLEREVIERILSETGGNVTHAARRLGLSRRGFQAKMKEFGLR